MNISINWIKDYVDLPEDISPRDLGVKIHPGHLRGGGGGNGPGNISKAVKVVRDHRRSSPIPTRTRLNLVTFDTGEGREAGSSAAPPMWPSARRFPSPASAPPCPAAFTLVHLRR